MIANVGGEAPDFELKTEDNQTWRLSEQRGKVVALLFYPKDETLVCTKQMCSVRDNWKEYLATKAVIVGISPGKTTAHQDFVQNHQLPLPVLADTDWQVTKTFAKQKWIPVWLNRAVIIIDGKGVIRSRKIMLWAFRPSDASIIASIYATRTELLYEKYNRLVDIRRTGG